jgi:hypothetical protein
MDNRDFFDDRYFEISTRLKTLREEVAEERRATPRRPMRPAETPGSRDADADVCARTGDQSPSRQPA